MKKAVINNELKNAMSNFGRAYADLRDAIESFEQQTGASVNDLHGFVANYPFAVSFDELCIDLWVDSVVDGAPQPDFKVVNYEYLNTGGNTMVGIHEVWLTEENKTVYVYTNEEGCSMVAVDYIRNDLDIDDYDELIIDFSDFATMTGHEKYFELYRHCLNQYTKDDCKYFGYTRCISYHLLSDELQETVDADYLVWLEAEYDGLVETNGLTTFENALYVQADNLLESIKEFDRWHETAADVDEFYDRDYTLEFAGHKVTLPYNADVWDAIDTMLENVIRSW